MKKFFSLFAALLFAGSMMAAETVVYTLTPASGSNNSYAGNCDITIEGITWNLTGNSTMQPWRIGGKSLTAVDRPLYSKTAIEDNITKIEIEHGAASSITVNSLTVIVASDANFANVISTLTPAFAASSTITVERPSGADWSNAYYKFVYNVTVSGSSNKFVEFKNAKFYAEEGDVPPTPSINYYVAGSMGVWGPDEAYRLTPSNNGEYEGEFTFAANDEFKVIGYDGTTVTWFPDGMNNNYVITEAGDYKITFNPAGNVEGWYAGFFNVVKKEAPVAISCLEVYQLAKNDVVGLLNPVTVTYSNGANVWVMDGSASMLIYLPSGFTNNFQAGDVLTGVAGVVDIYQTLVYEVKPSADQAAAIVATPGEAPAPSQAAVIEASDVNKYVILPGFSIEGTFTADSKTSLSAVLGENTVTIYNNFKFAYTFEAGKTYDIIGVVSAYKGNPQVYFISAVEATETAIDNTNSDAKVVKFFENGQLVIIKNGVRYNAQGAVVR